MSFKQNCTVAADHVLTVGDDNDAKRRKKPINFTVSLFFCIYFSRFRTRVMHETTKKEEIQQHTHTHTKKKVSGTSHRRGKVERSSVARA